MREQDGRGRLEEVEGLLGAGIVELLDVVAVGLSVDAIVGDGRAVAR